MESALPCPLINTARLKPFRQRLNRVIMTILDSGEVSMELMGFVNHSEVTKELFHISDDGTQIQIYQSLDGIASLNGCPVPGQANKIYTYPNFPTKQWKKYQHVYKFVDLVKSRTPKVMLVTEKAKCSLMENNPQPDFQACFYGGVKMLFSKSKIHITEADGSMISFDSEGINTHVDVSTKEMFAFAKKCQNQCLILEKSVNDLHSQDPTCDLFPITVGTNSRPFHFPLSDHENNGSGSKLSLELAALSSSSDCESQTTNHVLQTPLQPLSEGNGFLRTSDNYDNLTISNCLLNEQNSLVKKDECIALLQTHLYGNQLKTSKLQLQKLSIQENGAFCSESQIDQMLQAKLCQFGEYSNSSNSSFTSQSTTNTPQKATMALTKGCYYTSFPSFGSHTQCGQIHNSQFCQRHETDFSNFVGACDELSPDNSSSIDKDFVNPEDRPSDSHLHELSSNCLTDTAFTYNSNSEVDVLHAVTEEKSYHTTPLINSNAPINREYETSHNVVLVNGDMSSLSFSKSDDFLTPKKIHPPRSLIKYGSVDSKLPKQHTKHDWHNSSLNIYESGCQREQVKKNLVLDNAFIEPLVSPFKVATYRTLSEDILAFHPNPSLELSDCSESEDKTGSCQKSGLNGPQTIQNSKCMHNSCDTKYGASSNTLENNEEYLNNDPGIWMMSTPAHSCTDLVGQPFHTDESFIQSTDTNSQNTTSGNDSGLPSSEDPDSCNSGYSPYNSLQVKKSGTLNPDGTYDIQAYTKACSPPRKQNLMRKIAPISPEKKMSYLISKQKDHKRNSVQELKDLMDFGETKIPSANSSTCKVNSFSTSKTDCSSSSRAAPACLSPQKEFVMPSGFSEQAHPEQSLPVYVRNSLDMSCSSVYSDCSSPSSGCDPIRQIFVPYTGWASFYATGAVWILYNDGTQLGVKSNEATMTYIDQDGTQQKYKNNDVVPEIVKLKLEKLPAILNLLMKSPCSTVSSN